MVLGEPSRSPQQVLRAPVLLVLAVLAGLVGMHGLGAAGLPVPAHRAVSAAHHTAPASHQAADATAPPHACPGGQDGPAGHGSHADPACSSASVPSSPTAPVAAVGIHHPDAADRQPALRVPAGPDGGRAPPSLAELQLLRI
ncbi:MULTISPECIES: DUF6153 family protein [Streptomyces]|uniref:DUF6153 family protein n=1 Tax=Streptomyces TaxID=1883 RepID=UPI002175094B|nr:MULTISPECIES: DUF6153 family protein [unclassified Streptomyces]MCZ2528066.1 DUF6153 family protein [Streptomyces sp. HB2AG]